MTGKAEEPAARRGPRLVLWFVLVTALGLLLAGAATVIVVERALTRQGEHHAVDQAQVATRALLDRQLRPGDFTAPLSRARRRQLSALLSRKSLGALSSNASLFGRHGVVFAAAGPAAHGDAVVSVRRALSGQVVSNVATTGSGRVLRAFVPIALRTGGTRGVVELDQDYAPIAASARRSALLIAAALECLLVLLCVPLVPMLARASERLGRQSDEMDAMERRDGLKSELVATVSHELRTPLSAVLGFTELLLQGKLDDQTRTHHLETIQGEAQRLNGLIDEFLDLKKIEAGHFELSPEPIQLGELLAHEVDVFSVQSPIHTLELDVADQPLEIVGDHVRIGQLVANLLSNAIKYSPSGGTVRVGATATDRAVRVTISDSGIGIPSDQQASVFDQFFRVDSADSRKIRGTGLGLSLCQEIAEAHGGRIGVESCEGEGSTFWFELPVGRVVAA